MTFPNDCTCVIKMEYSEEEISAVLTASEQERKRLQKLGKVIETVAAYRLRELKTFQAREQLATRRRTHGYDRDDSWMHGTRPLSPQELTTSLWSEVKALKDAISMPRQKVRNLINTTEQGKVSDDEFAMLERLLEKRDCDAAHATVAPADTAQYRSPGSLTPEIPPDVCVDMEKEEEGRTNPEPTELELSSAGTGLETPGQQCPPNGETGRTTTDGCLLVGTDSNHGEDTSLHTKRVGTRAGTATTPANSPNTIFLRVSRKPEDKDKANEANKQFDP